MKQYLKFFLGTAILGVLISIFLLSCMGSRSVKKSDNPADPMTEVFGPRRSNPGSFHVGIEYNFSQDDISRGEWDMIMASVDKYQNSITI